MLSGDDYAEGMAMKVFRLSRRSRFSRGLSSVLARAVLPANSPERDAELVAMARTGSRHAVDVLSRSYLKLAGHLANRIARSPEDVDDLVQVGIAQFARKAIGRYDAGKGVKFSTFAACVMANAMLRAVRPKDGHPTSCVSLHAPLGSEDSATWLDVLADESADAAEMTRDTESQAVLARLMGELTASERRMVDGVYLGSMSFDDAANESGVKLGRAYQIAERGVQKMRKAAKVERDQLRLPGMARSA